MANKVLQILRNDVFYNSREEARTKLSSKLATLQDGEPAIAIYIDDGANKLLFGISAGNGQYTIFDPNAVPSDVQALIDAIVGEGTPDAAYDTLVEISSALTIINGVETVEGSIAKAEKDAKDYTDSQIDTVVEEIEDKITQVSVVNKDGSISVSAATSTGTPIGVKIRATDNALKLDPLTGLYVDSNQFTQYTGRGAIAITGSNPNKVVSLTIDGTDQVLTQTVSGLKTNLTLNWSSGTGLQLVGKDNQVLATVPAADFIKDGMLQNVELTQLEGNATLVFTFNTDAGNKVVNVNVQDLVDVYTQGNGINIAGNVVTAVAKTSDPIVEVVATGIGTREDAVWDCGTY